MSIRQAFRRSWEAFLRASHLAERRCAACHAPFSPPSASSLFGEGRALADWLCPACRTRLVRRELGFCPHCGEPSALPDAPCMPCGRCMQSLPPWQGFLFFGIHEGLLRELVLRGKFGGSLPSLGLLGALLGEVCAEHYAAAPLPDAIVPMPLHVSRLRERGFDQCAELAKAVGRRLGVPVRHDILVRVKATPPQASLSREQRMAMPQTFASHGAQGMHVLLLDDVCTTGATMRRAAESLLAGGACCVDAASVARASVHAAVPPLRPDASP